MMNSYNTKQRLPYQTPFAMNTLEALCLGLCTIIAITLTGCEAESVIPLLHSPKDRSIHVTGSGSVTGEPDIATLNLGVSVEKETVAEAREAAAVGMTAVLESLKANDIAEEDIQTENFSIRPQYDYTENGRMLRGYRVSNTINTKVRELQRLSDIIDDAAGAGGEIIVVNSVQFMIEDPTDLQMEARALAAKDAGAKAQTLADAHGVKLGKPVTITEVTSGGISPIVFAESVAAADSLRTSSPIEAGQLTVTVDITVVYEFE